MNCKDERYSALKLSLGWDGLKCADGLLARFPVEQGKTCCAKSHDEQERPDEEPSKHGEECGEL